MLRLPYQVALAALALAGCDAEHQGADVAGGAAAHAVASPRVAAGVGGEPVAPAEGGSPGLAPAEAGGAGFAPAEAGSAGEAAAPEPEPPATACERHRVVLDGQVVNARDLGGLPLASGGHVACGSLFRGPPLAALDLEGCSHVAALGIRTVIDLRMEHERESRPTTPCVDAGQVLAPLPIPFGLGPTDYLNDLNSPSVAVALHALASAEAYPIYFHCTWGRDRTGVLSALLLRALGVSREDVMQEYLLSQSSVGAYPNSLDAVLDEIEARGGAEAFLLEIGISASELATLRARATVSE
ncbi:MAG TPA: tyrosine-protein phosphatase [Polyangiaceae bacterium]